MEFLYLRDVNGHPFATVVCEVQLHRSAPDQLRIAAAFCSPKDRFVKKIGRDIAAGRLKNRAWGRGYTVLDDYEAKYIRSIWQFANQLFKNAPDWIKDSSDWIKDSWGYDIYEQDYYKLCKWLNIVLQKAVAEKNLDKVVA